jgi:hypothetical protein
MIRGKFYDTYNLNYTIQNRNGLPIYEIIYHFVITHLAGPEVPQPCFLCCCRDTIHQW